jgi:hypothetical protein
MGNDHEDELPVLLRSTRIIVVALAVGVVVFGVIAIFMTGGNVQLEVERGKAEQVHTGFSAMAIVALFWSAVCVLARLFVPGIVVASACRKIGRGTWQQSGSPQPESDEGKLLHVFHSKTIIGCAVMEFAAFINVFAYMIDGGLFAIVLAFVFAMVILSAFPTRTGYDSWLEKHMRLVVEIRSMPGQ